MNDALGIETMLAHGYNEKEYQMFYEENSDIATYIYKKQSGIWYHKLNPKLTVRPPLNDHIFNIIVPGEVLVALDRSITSAEAEEYNVNISLYRVNLKMSNQDDLLLYVWRLFSFLFLICCNSAQHAMVVANENIPQQSRDAAISMEMD